MDPKDIEWFHNHLTQMLKEITETGDATLTDLGDSQDQCADPADRATQESDRAFTLRLRDRERRLIRKVREALARIEDNSYGVCEECGDDIGIARLKARPVTTLCIKCKSRQEEEEKRRPEEE